MIKVLHILSDMDPGGAQYVVLDMVRNIDRDRFQPYVCCLRSGGGLVGRLHDQNVPFHLVHFGSRLSPVGLWKLQGLIRELGVQIVHTHLRRANHAGRLAAVLAGTPVICAHHHDTILEAKWRQKKLTAFLGKRTDSIFCVSDEVRLTRLGAGDEPDDRLRVLYNFIEPSDYANVHESPVDMKAELGFPADLPTVGIVARLHPFKNHELFLQTAKKLVEEDPAVHFAIIGDGKLKGQLQERARELNISRFVTFTGNRNDMPRVYKALDVTVLCSTREGFGKVILESQASGVPVVAHKVGGVAEVLADGGGLLVTESTPEAFAAAIDHALQPEQRERLVQQSLKAVQRFSATRIMTDLEDIYTDLCEQKHAYTHVY